MSLLAMFGGLVAVTIAAPAAEVGQRLRHAHGFILVLRDGLSASATPTGFIISPQNGGDVREPIEVDVDVIAPRLPDGLQSCWFMEPALQCSWQRGEEAGSLGEPVMITVHAPLGEKFIRYRQLKHADGYGPSFDILEWLKTGGVAVEQSR
jgi:hypothetical protein